MKVLFVGGTGIISPACVDLAIERGHEVWVLNRGNHPDNLNPAAKLIRADYDDEKAVETALGDHTFDVTADFRIFNAFQMEKAVRLFKNRTKQYILISTTVVYRKPLDHYIVTEEAPLGNPYSYYGRNKLAAEEVLRQALQSGFPGVIVRPSLTYSDRNVLTSLRGKDGYALIDRMRKGKEIVVNGDGTSLWTITHNTDFARAFVGLFGNEKAVGEAFHITSDEVLTWDKIYTTLAHAAGVEARLIHMSTDFIGEIYPDLKDGLAGDHSVSAVYDNTKIKKFVPDFTCRVSFEEGARRSVAWFDADPAARETPDPEWDARMDHLIECRRAYLKLGM